MYELLKSWLFRQDAERSHDITLSILSRYANTPLSWCWRQRVELKPVKVMGIEFPNPVGLAAGLDKDARCITAFEQMGFGFIEVGTVTPKAQPGNPQPRLFRLPDDDAIINRMGFNNQGVEALAKRVRAVHHRAVLGINIGKNKETAESDALNDYLTGLDCVYNLADYITINISSPNTPGLRDFQHGEALSQLLAGLKQRQQSLAEKFQKYVPLVVKIAPDLSEGEIKTMATAFNDQHIDGVIATNTTLSREGLTNEALAAEAGGLSGAPVRAMSTQVISSLRQHLNADIPIIGVGGIDSAASAQEKLDAGASLVQVYTGFIYKGPKLIKEIVNSL